MVRQGGFLGPSVSGGRAVGEAQKPLCNCRRTRHLLGASRKGSQEVSCPGSHFLAGNPHAKGSVAVSPLKDLAPGPPPGTQGKPCALCRSPGGLRPPPQPRCGRAGRAWASGSPGRLLRPPGSRGCASAASGAERNEGREEAGEAPRAVG